MTNNADEPVVSNGSSGQMVVLDKLIGFASDPALAERIHQLEHADLVEYLAISPEDTNRRRLRTKTDKETDCAIALGRDQKLGDGAVLMLNDNGAIIIRVTEQRWLKLRATDSACALQLGYFVGNLHWKVEFDSDIIFVAMEGPRSDYLQRLDQFSALSAVLVYDEEQ